MKIVIPGGSGQIGSILARQFSNKGHDVVVLSRAATSSNSTPVPIVTWDAKNPGDWCQQIDGCDVVINLAGRSVDCRYNKRNRQQILASRIDATRAVGKAIANADHPPKVWLQACTATIYAHRYDAANDEASGIIGGNEPDVPETWRFSIGVAKAWEVAAAEFELPQTRQVLMRMAMTMSPDADGVFDVLLGLVRKGLGGRNGDGRQFVSWIHEQDFLRAIEWLIEHDDLTGPINIASPNPVPNAEFMQALRKAWGIRFGLPANRLMLEIGAMFLKTETELILKSRRVVPGRLIQSGFEFNFPTWQKAVVDLCRRWRKQNR